MDGIDPVAHDLVAGFRGLDAELLPAESSTVPGATRTDHADIPTVVTTMASWAALPETVSDATSAS